MNEDLGLLFHKLNNQLGIILANAELLEAKLGEDAARARASQVVASALEAMTTAREIRVRLKDESAINPDANGTSAGSRPDLSN
jgi:hypothetical protein